MPRKIQHIMTKSRGIKCLVEMMCFFGMILIPNMADANSGVFALDEPAIHVLRPVKVYLDALDIAGNKIIAGGEHGVIIYSGDNGATWTQAHVPVDVTITAFSFADSKYGWAVGSSGVVLFTANGGKDWSLQLNGFQADKLMMKAAEKAVADKNPSVGTPMALNRAQILMKRGASTPFLCVLALSRQNVLAFGAYRMTMRSTDGGRNWQDASLDIDDPLSHDLYGAAIVDDNIYVVGEMGLVFRSTDGGKTYPAVTKAANATLFGVVGAENGSVVVYGVAGTLARSTDKGKSWKTISMPSTADLTDGILLASGKLLITGADGAVYISSNNGRTYKTAKHYIPMAVFAVAQAPNGKLVFAGSRGIMIESIHKLDQK